MIEIAIATPEGTEPVRGYRTDVDGLVAHRSKHGLGWCLTHDTSGHLILDGIRTLRDCRKAAKRLGEVLSDWTPEPQALRELLPAGFRPRSVLQDAEQQ